MCPLYRGGGGSGGGPSCGHSAGNCWKTNQNHLISPLLLSSSQIEFEVFHLLFHLCLFPETTWNYLESSTLPNWCSKILFFSVFVWIWRRLISSTVIIWSQLIVFTNGPTSTHKHTVFFASPVIAPDFWKFLNYSDLKCTTDQKMKACDRNTRGFDI